MLVEKIYEEMKWQNIVTNSRQFSTMYLELNENAYNLMHYKKKDFNAKTKLKLYKNLNEIRKKLSCEKRNTVNRMLNMISEDIAKDYRIKIKYLPSY
mgnify:FL=1|jgi:hypothetical protein